MTVKELLSEISLMPPETEIFLSDSEGNFYKKLQGCDKNVHKTQKGFFDSRWTADEACFKESEWENLLAQSKPCLTLYHL